MECSHTQHQSRSQAIFIFLHHIYFTHYRSVGILRCVSYRTSIWVIIISCDRSLTNKMKRNFEVRTPSKYYSGDNHILRSKQNETNLFTLMGCLHFQSNCQPLSSATKIQTIPHSGIFSHPTKQTNKQTNLLATRNRTKPTD